MAIIKEIKTKEWYKSLTIQSAFGTILLILGNSLITKQIGYEEIIVCLGCVGAIYGRIRANKNIKSLN